MSPTAAPIVDVSNFDLTSLLRCSRALRQATAGSGSLEESAGRITRILYDVCVDPDTGERSCAMVRFYKTHDFEALPSSLRAFVRRQMPGEEPRPDMKALALLATVGDEAAWNDRKRSRGHQAIPLASVEMVERAPMISALIRQFGLSVQQAVRPHTDMLPDREGKAYNVFHVPEAQGSPFIPAQADFVERYGIQSVIGFGGALRSGNLFATILFSRRPIPAESAARFRSLAVDVKGILFFQDEARTFAD